MRIIGLQTLAAALLALGVSSLPASATVLRTFVSGLGTDTGTCARTTPCGTFAYAITQTSPGGEIDVLTPGDYGPVTITQAVSIVQDGAGEAGVSPASGSGIIIDAGASDAISLRGLTFNGGGSASEGIYYKAGGSLRIVRCAIRNFASYGIRIEPTAPNTVMTFAIADTFVAESSNNIYIRPRGSGVYQGVLDHVAAVDGVYGIAVLPGSNPITYSVDVTITGSVAENHTFAGIYSQGGTNANMNVTVRDTASSYNGQGFQAFAAGGVIRLAHSVATGNSVGASTVGGGIIYSSGDNDIDGNVSDVSGSLTPDPDK